jgi:hypothetical protein
MALAHLARFADVFVGEDVRIPKPNWEAELAKRALDYSGELASKAQNTTLEQVAPSLPPDGVAGSVDALALSGGPVHRLLEDPFEVLLPRADWPSDLRPTKLRSSPSEYADLVDHLEKLDVVEFLADDELVWHGGAPLASGIFGVSKGKRVLSPTTGREVEVLRLIINMTPFNACQKLVDLDVGTLP